MDKQLLKAIENVIDYLYETELKDYESLEFKDNNHIFNSVKKVNNWINRVKKV